MVDEVAERLLGRSSACIASARRSRDGGVRLLGTSGTVTTLAGVALELPRYRRPLVDGVVLSHAAAADARWRGCARWAGRPRRASLRRRRAGGFVLPGCAVFRPSGGLAGAEVTVADRGLREGMLLRMMRAGRPRRDGGRGRRRCRCARSQPDQEVDHTAGPRGLSVMLRTANRRTTASQQWLQRQLNDPYVAAAQAAGLALARGVQADRAGRGFHLLRRGMRVRRSRRGPGRLEPGRGARGAPAVVGLDLLAIEPVPGATFVQGDFNDPDMPERLRRCWAARPTSCCPTWRRTPPGTPRPTTSASWRWPNWRSTSPSGCWRRAAAFVAKVFQGGSERQMLAPHEARSPRAPRQAAGEPQGVERAVRGRDRISRRGPG